MIKTTPLQNRTALKAVKLRHKQHKIIFTAWANDERLALQNHLLKVMKKAKYNLKVGQL